ncbi:MAG TPA: NIPSNAP family protein [Stellaceae bacterium]|jgi:hypothetical protein|nr:NIPSNAP family protein [Stellaceae bacterium]
MILEVRTYVAQTGGGTARWLEHYEKYGLPPSKRHLGQLVGFFTTEIGPLNQIIHMWRYESLADREARRAALYADPDWQFFLKNGPQPTPLISQESKILIPTSFSPLK